MEKFSSSSSKISFVFVFRNEHFPSEKEEVGVTWKPNILIASKAHFMENISGDEAFR